MDIKNKRNKKNMRNKIKKRNNRYSLANERPPVSYYTDQVPLVDMRYIYYRLSKEYANKPDECPIVIVHYKQDIDGEVLLLWSNERQNRKTMIIYADTTEEMNILFDQKMESPSIDGKTSISFDYDNDEYYWLICSSLKLSKILKVYCPPIYILPSESSYGQTIYDYYSGSDQIIISSHIGSLMFVALAHEMRHVWQHVYLGVECFAEYQDIEIKTPQDHLKYVTKPYEADAHAFAHAYLRSVYDGEEIDFCETISDEINSVITNYADNLYRNYFLCEKNEKLTIA